MKLSIFMYFYRIILATIATSCWFFFTLPQPLHYFFVFIIENIYVNLPYCQHKLYFFTCSSLLVTHTHTLFLFWWLEKQFAHLNNFNIPQKSTFLYLWVTALFSVSIDFSGKITVVWSLSHVWGVLKTKNIIQTFL